MSTADHQSRSTEVPDVVDWLVTLVLAIGGTALAAAGAVTLLVADRDTAADELAGEEITVLGADRTLTGPEAATLVSDLIGWTGLGLLVTGVGVVALAVGYGVSRYRVWGADAHETARQTERQAVVCGAAATLLLPAVPLSGLFGGAVAASLGRADPDRSVRLGSLAGALAAVPAAVILAFVGVGTYTGLSVLGEAGVRVAALLVLLAAGVLSVLVTTAFGGVGGYVAGRLRAAD